MQIPHLPRQENAAFSPQGFLERAHWWLAMDEDVAILYASLELRYAFEAIVVKHGLASADDSKTFDKLHHQPGKLFKKLRNEFAGRLDITKSYRFYLNGNETGAQMLVGRGLQQLEEDGTLTWGYFLALPERFFSLYGRLDANLHGTWAGRDVRLPQRPWYTEQHQFLMDFADQLAPHTNPKNALVDPTSPRLNMKWEEVVTTEVEKVLRQTAS